MPSNNEPSGSPTTDNGHAANGTQDGPRSPSAPGWLAVLRSRLGLGAQQTLRETLEEAVRSETAADATFSATERDMLLRLLRFGGLRVDDVMLPRADIVALDEESTVGELIQLFETAGVSRIPIYHETLDDPRGMVHVKDLLGYLARREGWWPAPPGATDEAPAPANDPVGASRARSIKAAGIMRPVLNVPASMPAINLLIRMQSTRNHIALVVDEYGGTDGLVTIEDLVEQVVGDIEDEYDVDEVANIAEDIRHGLVAQARTPIGELEAHLGVKLLKPDEEGEIDTLGGLVVSRAGRVPARGELVNHDSGYEFEVLEADPRRIKRLKVHRPQVSGDGPRSSEAQGAATPAMSSEAAGPGRDAGSGGSRASG